MAWTPYEATAREAHRVQANQNELADRIAHTVASSGRVEPLPGLFFNRADTPGNPVHVVAQPCLCVMAQGSKAIHLGAHRYEYNPCHYLLVTADLPLMGQVLQASEARPYLSLRLNLDPKMVSSVMVEAGHAPPPSGGVVRALDVSPLSADLLDAVVRLTRLQERPSEASVLSPLITREIVFRLLTGDQGARLRHLAVFGGRRHRVAQAVHRLRTHFDQPLSIDHLAEELGMSVSSFHHQFRVVTGMSPLQYQKQLKLQEARRLMLSEALDAATAGYRVGYNDASHFSREYKRLFGQPPRRDVEHFRMATAEHA